MSVNRYRRSDRRAMDRILGDDPIIADPFLHDLLAAAAAPPSEAELAGEQAAVAAFRAAHVVPVPRLRRISMIKTTLAKLLTTKLAVAAAATAAVTAGGVVAVAATGVLPGSGSSGSSAPSAGASSTASSSEAESTHGQEATPTGTGRPSETPSPSLTGLCHAYTAGDKADHGKALENPAFTVLITTAGGKDKVDDYCAKLLATSSDPATTTAKSSRTEVHATQDPDAHAPSTPAHPSH